MRAHTSSLAAEWPVASNSHGAGRHAGRLASAMWRWLLLVAAIAARGGHSQYVLPRTARWLSHYCGLSRRTAADHVRVARALAAHPARGEAMAAARLSFSHARAIIRVAELADLIAELVTVAEHGTVGQLEEVVCGLRTVDRDNDAATPDGADPEAADTMSHHWRDDSFLGLSAKLGPEQGALLLSAVETLARREGMTHAAALSRMAEITLAGLNASNGPAPPLRGGEYAAVVVHIDAADYPAPDEANRQAQVESGSGERAQDAQPYGRIARGPGLPDATVQRLLCTGRVPAIVTSEHPDEAHVDDVGQRRGIRWRNGVPDVGASRPDFDPWASPPAAKRLIA